MRGAEPKGDRSSIWISFPGKYFHSYDAIFDVREEPIYVRRNGKWMIVFKDNGLLDYMEELKEDAAEKKLRKNDEIQKGLRLDFAGGL